MIEFAPPAIAAIQAVYDDPALDTLAERLEEILELLESDPGNQRVRRNRMQEPKVWAIPIYGSGREMVLLWDFTDEGNPRVRYAGDRF